MAYIKNHFKDIRINAGSKPPLSFRILYGILLTIAVISIFSWAFIDFNLGDFTLVRIGVITGLVIALLANLIIKKLIPPIAPAEKRKKLEISISIALIFLNLILLALQYYNQSFNNNALSCKEYSTINKSESSGGFAFHTFTISINGKENTIHCEKDLWDNLQTGKTLSLCTAKCGLGFSYIKYIQKL